MMISGDPAQHAKSPTRSECGPPARIYCCSRSMPLRASEINLTTVSLTIFVSSRRGAPQNFVPLIGGIAIGLPRYLVWDWVQSISGSSGGTMRPISAHRCRATSSALAITSTRYPAARSHSICASDSKPFTSNPSAPRCRAVWRKISKSELCRNCRRPSRSVASIRTK